MRLNVINYQLSSQPPAFSRLTNLQYTKPLCDFSAAIIYTQSPIYWGNWYKHSVIFVLLYHFSTKQWQYCYLLVVCGFCHFMQRHGNTGAQMYAVWSNRSAINSTLIKVVMFSFCWNWYPSSMGSHSSVTKSGRFFRTQVSLLSFLEHFPNYHHLEGYGWILHVFIHFKLVS